MKALIVMLWTARGIPLVNSLEVQGAGLPQRHAWGTGSCRQPELHNTPQRRWPPPVATVFSSLSAVTLECLLVLRSCIRHLVSNAVSSRCIWFERRHSFASSPGQPGMQAQHVHANRVKHVPSSGSLNDLNTHVTEEPRMCLARHVGAG